MDIRIGDLLTVEGKNYITLEKLSYENNEYIFVNKVINEAEVSDEYYIFKVVDGGVKFLVDNDLMNKLLPEFQKLLESDMSKILEG